MTISQKNQNKTNKTKTNKQRKTYRIHKIQSTDFKTLKKCPSEYTSVLLGREKKAIISGEEGRDLGGRGIRWGVGDLIWY